MGLHKAMKRGYKLAVSLAGQIGAFNDRGVITKIQMVQQSRHHGLLVIALFPVVYHISVSTVIFIWLRKQNFRTCISDHKHNYCVVITVDVHVQMNFVHNLW